MIHDALWGPITNRIHRLKEESGALVRLQFLQSVSAGTQIVHRHSRGLRSRHGLLIFLLLLFLTLGRRDNEATLTLRSNGCLGG